MKSSNNIFPVFLASAMILALMAFSDSATARVYSWTDDKGKKHFTSNPAKVPRKYREKPKKPNFRKTGNGWECVKRVEPKTLKEWLKSDNNLQLWEKEIKRNKKDLKELKTEKGKKLKMGIPVDAEEKIFKIKMERIEDLEGYIKQTQGHLDKEKKKYHCK